MVCIQTKKKEVEMSNVNFTIHVNTFLWYNLPDALQGQWFVHVSILSIFPP